MRIYDCCDMMLRLSEVLRGRLLLCIGKLRTSEVLRRRLLLGIGKLRCDAARN